MRNEITINYDLINKELERLKDDYWHIKKHKDKNVAKLCDYLNAHSYKPQYEVIYWCTQEDYESNSTKKILYELDSIEESISIATNLVRGFYAAQVRNINTKEILWTSPVDKK